MTQVHDLACCCIGCYMFECGLLNQCIQIPLQNLPSNRLIASPELVLSVNLLSVHLIPSSRSLLEMLKKTGPNTDSGVSSVVTTTNCTELHSLSLFESSHPTSYSHSELGMCPSQEELVYPGENCEKQSKVLH